MPKTPPARTRDAVLGIIKRRGPQEVRDLAVMLGITEIAVRQHLQRLEADGLVAASPERRKVGRPAMLWGLTQAAQARFADSHSDLALDLLGDFKALFGEEGMERLLTRRAARQVDTYGAAMDGARDLKARLEALSESRSREGYMAEVEETDGDGYLFVENHCPICEAAKACSGLCAQELSVFREALGPDVEVERTDHILAGARRCAYRVRMKEGQHGS